MTDALMLAAAIIAGCLVIAYPEAALRAAVRIVAWIVHPYGEGPHPPPRMGPR